MLLLLYSVASAGFPSNSTGQFYHPFRPPRRQIQRNTESLHFVQFQYGHILVLTVELNTTTPPESKAQISGSMV